MLKKYNEFLNEKTNITENDVMNEGLISDLFTKFWNYLKSKFGTKTWETYVYMMAERKKLDRKKVEIFIDGKKITKGQNEADEIEEGFQEEIDTDIAEIEAQRATQGQVQGQIKTQSQEEAQEEFQKIKESLLNEDLVDIKSANIHIDDCSMSELKSDIENGYEMRLSKNGKGTIDPIFIWGAPGIGKTESIQQYCDKNDLNLIVWHLATVQPVDFVGVPSVEAGKTIYNLPALFPRSGEVDKGGILFFDELNRADSDVLSAALQMANEGMVGEYKMPANWWIVAAGNRDADEPGRITEMGSALSARFAHVNLVPTVKEWIEWAITNNKLHKDILAFFAIEKNQKTYFHRLDTDRGDHPWANPRNWVKASFEYEFLLNKFKGRLNDRETRRIFNKIVGIEAATEFVAFLKIKDKFNEKDIAQVYSDPTKAKLIDEDDRLDIVAAIMVYIAFYKNRQEVTDEEVQNLFKYALRYTEVELTTTMLLGYFKNCHPGVEKKKVWIEGVKEWNIKFKKKLS